MTQTTGIPVQSALEQDTALLVIDVQQGLFRKSTPIYRGEPLLNTLEALIERCPCCRYARGLHANTPPLRLLPFGSADWQLHPRLHPDEGDLVFHKQHGNAFEGTSLHAEMTARGIGRVIVTVPW